MKDKRERLIEAGVFQFSLYGINNARVEDITKQAGVAKGTFYTYFKSKEDLLEQLMEMNMERYTDLFVAIKESNLNFEGKVKMYLKQRLKKFAEHPKFFYMILSLRNNGEIKILHGLRKKLGKRGDKLIKKFFQEHIEEIKEEYRKELDIICPSIMASLFIYQDVIAEKIDVDITCEEDYGEINKKLLELDFNKYVKQFYNLNIKEMLREG